MCLIVSGIGTQIPLELLQDAANKNADGWGAMWHDGQRIVVEKATKTDPEAIYSLTRTLDREVIVHLRMATHGDNSMANTHPFEVVPGKLYMMHNGIVSVPTSGKRSDTRVLVEDYLQPLIGSRPGRMQNPGLRRFVQDMIGDSSNRLVFLDHRGKVDYFNKRLGIQWRGLWCSNTYAWTLWDERPRSPKSTKSVNTSRLWDWRGLPYEANHTPDDDDLDLRWNDLDPWVEELLTMEYDDMMQVPKKDLVWALEYLKEVVA